MRTIAGATAIIVALVIVPPLYAATTASFDGGADTPSTLQAFGFTAIAPTYQAAGGNPGGYLQLTDAVGGLHNWATFDRSDAGSYPLSTFSFDFRISAFLGGGTADGFSFSYAPTSVYGTAGGIGGAPFIGAENPAASGVLGFGFDTFSNAGQFPDGVFDNPSVPFGSDYQEISVFFNGGLVGRIDDTRLLASPFSLDDGVWHSVTGSVNFAAGLVSLSVDGQNIWNTIPIPGLVPFESRIMLAARTAGEAEIAGIDNINVQLPEPAGWVLALTAFGILVLPRRRR